MKVIHLVRKPLSEPTVAMNVLKHGTGALNIDASRVGTDWSQESSVRRGHSKKSCASNGVTGWNPRMHAEPHQGGRWPSNLILEHLPECQPGECVSGCPILELDSMGVRRSSGIFSPTDHHPTGEGWATSNTVTKGGFGSKRGVPASMYADHGGASRFFKQVGGSRQDPDT